MMLYLVTGTKPPEALALVRSTPPRSGNGLGYIAQPGSNSLPDAGWWAGDNGCVMSGPTGVPVPNPRWAADRWMSWLEGNVEAARRCLFVVLPDVVCDHRATLARSMPYVDRVRELGFPVALAAQNGAEADRSLPWDRLDALFLAGDDRFKLGQPAHVLATRARDRGLWVHMGRVNSAKRLRRAAVMGCDSADGTFLAKAPDKNLPRLLTWFDKLTASPPIPLGGAA